MVTATLVWMIRERRCWWSQQTPASTFGTSAASCRMGFYSSNSHLLCWVKLRLPDPYHLLQTINVSSTSDKTNQSSNSKQTGEMIITWNVSMSMLGSILLSDLHNIKTTSKSICFGFLSQYSSVDYWKFLPQQDLLSVIVYFKL